MDGRNTSVAWVVAVLVLSSAWIVAVRLWTVGEPLDRDAATYAVAGREMLAGRVLYRDVFDHKPPGVHLSFMVAQAMGGSTEETVVVLGFLTALATMAGVFVVARRIAWSSGAGAAAALFWAITSATLGLQANQLNTEAFVNLFVVWAVAMLVECPPMRANTLAAGILLGCASLFKTVVAAQAVALVFAVILGGPGRVGERVGKASVMAAGGLAPWLITVAAFAALGALREMVFAVFGYNALYAGDQVANILHGLSPALMAPPVLLPLLPIAGVTMLLPLKWQRPTALPDLVLVAWLLSVPVAIAWPGRYAPHYYQLWLPVLPVVAAVVLWRVSTRPARLAVGVTLALVGLQAPALTLGPEACSLRKYGPVFLEARELGREIRRNLGDRASFWEWGAETSLYFYSGVSPPTRFFYNYPLEVVPERYTEVVTREVTQADPELVVIYRREMLPMPPDLAAWLHRGYERFIADEAWELWRRKERGSDECVVAHPVVVRRRLWPAGEVGTTSPTFSASRAASARLDSDGLLWLQAQSKARERSAPTCP